MDETPRRKEPRRFEPPPWEREQFEQLAKKKAEEEAQAAAEREAEETRERAERETEKAQAEAERVAEEKASARPRAANGGARDEGRKEDEEESEKEALDIDQMMVILQAEEPSPVKGLWVAGTIASIFMAVIGAIFMVWGIVAFRATQGASLGQMGAGILLFFGIGFIAMAAWTIQRSLRQRGA